MSAAGRFSLLTLSIKSTSVEKVNDVDTDRVMSNGVMDQSSPHEEVGPALDFRTTRKGKAELCQSSREYG